MIRYYRLQNGIPVLCQDILEWSMWFEGNLQERIVEQTTAGDLFVSTVFLGLDHSYSEDGPPLIYETMVFNKAIDKSDDLLCQRYSTLGEAKFGHFAVLEQIGRKGTDACQSEWNAPPDGDTEAERQDPHGGLSDP